MRIVSLVPSLTVTVCDLELRKSMVGCTTFCVRPKGIYHEATLVGGTKNPDLEVISRLNPTHIIVNLEENREPDILACRKLAEVIETFPKSPSDVPPMLRKLGETLHREEMANSFSDSIEQQLGKLKVTNPDKRFLYYIWSDPYMVAGRDTYISRSLELLGLGNACDSEDRYPQFSIETAKESKAEMIFFSTEPFAFRRRHAERMRQEWPECPDIFLIDGQLLSWYGTLTLKMLVEFGHWREFGLSEVLKKL